MSIFTICETSSLLTPYYSSERIEYMLYESFTLFWKDFWSKFWKYDISCISQKMHHMTSYVRFLSLTFEYHKTHRREHLDYESILFHIKNHGKNTRSESDERTFHQQHFCDPKKHKCQFSRFLKLARCWPRITLQSV